MFYKFISYWLITLQVAAMISANTTAETYEDFLRVVVDALVKRARDLTGESDA